MKEKYCTAIVLAGGRGRRMGTKVHKQYLLIQNKPVLYYSLKMFQKSALIDEIILITGAGEEEYCREQIVEKYGISKVKHIVQGGAERYHSVFNGLEKVREEGVVFIHDGARPFVDESILERAYNCVARYHACAAGMPVKDTVKIVDAAQFVENTPDRRSVWIVQTPQVFDVQLVKAAYQKMMSQTEIAVTDDAMVVETYMKVPVKLYKGSYENIKITTPEDLSIAEGFLKKGLTDKKGLCYND